MHARYIYIRPAPATAHARRYAQTYVSSRLKLRSRSPQNAQHFTSVRLLMVYWGERERGPLLWTRRTRCRRYIYTAGTRYCACAALRANVAGRIGNRFCTVCDFSHARPIMLSIPLVVLRESLLTVRLAISEIKPVQSLTDRRTDRQTD